METSSKQQLMEISINHKGVDVIAVVSVEEASILMNDEAAAGKFAEALLAQQGQQEHQVPEDVEYEHQNCVDGQDQEVTQNSQQKASQKPDYFSSRDATLLFLSLRTKYNDKFNDRKTLKNSLWQKIVVEMRSSGYVIPEGREGAEKCRQKFANLQRGYLNYVKHMKTTGVEKRDPPPYFDEMNAILGTKDKGSPPYLEDSLDTSSQSINVDTETEPTASCSSSSSSSINNKQKEIKNRFSSCNSSIRPTTNFNKIMELFKEQHEELRKDKEKHMRVLENAIKVQNDQRERFLDFLEKTEKRKRRRGSSSSDE